MIKVLFYLDIHIFIKFSNGLILRGLLSIQMDLTFTIIQPVYLNLIIMNLTTKLIAIV